MMPTNVLFVPGFLGSHLYSKWFNNRPTERVYKIWLDQALLAIGGWKYLDPLDNAGSFAEGNVIPAGLLEDYYQPWLEFLRRKGAFVIPWAYDFRRDILHNGNILADYLQRNTAFGSDIIVVGHSMGGLVAATALQQLGDEASRRVPFLITVGTPWYGSWRTHEILMGTDSTVRLIRRVSGTLQFLNPTFNSDQLIRIFARWPGVYDLMPHQVLGNQFLNNPYRDPFSWDYWRDINSAVSPEELSACQERRVVGRALPTGTQHINIRGLGYYTVAGEPTFNGIADIRFNFHADGDGVVVPQSAVAPQIFGARHFDLRFVHDQGMNDAEVQRLIGNQIGLT